MGQRSTDHRQSALVKLATWLRARACLSLLGGLACVLVVLAFNAADGRAAPAPSPTETATETNVEAPSTAPTSDEQVSQASGPDQTGTDETATDETATDEGSTARDDTVTDTPVAERDASDGIQPQVDQTVVMPRHLGNDGSRLEDQQAAAEFLDKLSSEAFTVLNDSKMADEVRHEAFRTLLSEGLAVDFIGRLMLGSHRKTATDEQLRQYREVFPDYITRLYASQLAKLAKVRMQIVETEPINTRDVRVRTNLFRDNGGPITVDWRVRRRKTDSFQIIDIFFEGVSIVLTKRDEFNALVRNRGFDALLAELQLRTSAVSGVL